MNPSLGTGSPGPPRKLRIPTSHLFSTMQDRPFQGIDEQYFLRLLAVTARLAETVRLADTNDPQKPSPTRRKA
jgi:hypothetical protein